MKETRIGIGFDAHRFGEGKKLFLGCVEIPFEKGLEGHSDADVLAHSVCDALLGAAGLGDIGIHFPDSDPKYKDIPGAVLLRKTREKIAMAGFDVVNVDAVVICEKPRISPYREAMRKEVAHSLGIDGGRVNIKATTTETMGFTGRKEGIVAGAVSLIVRKTEDEKG